MLNDFVYERQKDSVREHTETACATLIDVVQYYIAVFGQALHEQNQ